MDADEYTALGGRLDMAQIDGWYGRFEDIEIDPTFLCLTDLYAAAAPLVPADWTVVDLGGYVGVQAGLFAGRYVDVDCYDLCGGADYTPPGVTGRATRSTSSQTSRHGWARTLGFRAARSCSCPACHGTSGSWTDCGRAGAIGPSGIRGNPPKGMAPWAPPSPP